MLLLGVQPLHDQPRAHVVNWHGAPCMSLLISLRHSFNVIFCPEVDSGAGVPQIIMEIVCDSRPCIVSILGIVYISCTYR